MEYKQLIENWHAKASGEDYFSKFVFEYLAFIAFLKTQKYESTDTDRRAIQKFKRNNLIKEKYLQKINSKEDLKEDWEQIKEKLEEVPLGNASRDLNTVEELIWWNCSPNERNQMIQEDESKTKGVIHSLEDWENMVEFWHSIRNNLFHGAKSPENARDQFVVKYGYLTLKELMVLLLYEQD